MSHDIEIFYKDNDKLHIRYGRTCIIVAQRDRPPVELTMHWLKITNTLEADHERQ